MTIESPSRSCPYRDDDGRLAFATYHQDLGNVKAFPVRENGDMIVAGRSWVPDEYADGWVAYYPIRDNSDNKVYAVKPLGEPIADCWPETITTLWTGVIGALLNVSGFNPQITFLSFSGTYTLTKDDYVSNQHSCVVRYKRDFSGTMLPASYPSGWFWEYEFPGGINWSITTYLYFGSKVAGVTGYYGSPSTSTADTTTDLVTVCGFCYKLSLESVSNPSRSMSDFFGNSGSIECHNLQWTGLESDGESYWYDGFFEEHNICGPRTFLWHSGAGPSLHYFSGTCTDVLDYLSLNSIGVVSAQYRRMLIYDTPYEYAGHGPYFAGMTYA